MGIINEDILNFKKHNDFMSKNNHTCILTRTNLHKHLAALDSFIITLKNVMRWLITLKKLPGAAKPSKITLYLSFDLMAEE